MALKLSEHPRHKAPEVVPFHAAEPERSGEWVPGGERGEILELVPSDQASLGVGTFAVPEVVEDGPVPPEMLSPVPFPAVLTDLASDPPCRVTARGTWFFMDRAPCDRPVYMTADPDADPDGILAIWRTTREKLVGCRGWRTVSYWAAVLTRQRLGFEPRYWRESMAGPPGQAA